MNKSNRTLFFGSILFVSILISYIYSEDTLGGARIDYLFHEKFIILFAEDFKNTFINYGQDELFARNSPIFYILLSLIYKIGIDLDTIRYINILSIILLTYIFYSCLKIQFKKFDNSLLILLSLVVFLSPTVRSLVVWPYPILYAFILFLLSVKSYLKFNQEKNFKIIEALKNTFFLALASYITPNFCVFVIFFLYKFFLGFKNKKFFIYILFFNFLLALPALIYYYTFDFYLIKYTVHSVDLNTKINLFNKIILISSLIFFYFIPFLNKKVIKTTLIAFKSFYNQHILLIFFLVCIYFFNFPIGYFGGGIFYHFSQLIFGNNILLFTIFLLSIIIFKSSKLLNFNNMLLFFCLILYNLQVSIYHKYFDPLILFLLFFLVTNNKITNQKVFFEIIKKYYLFYVFFLGISFYKVIFL
tara:strand:- start:1485 stop:2732 length:1248 start_codon:yes stop_codon:yes gene_type:complete